MFIDGRNVPDGTVIETDLAIIGAGAAGITIAREMRNSGLKVTLIESGGLDFEADTQALYQGENKGVDYPLDGARLRYFGGSTNHWGGWCRPLADIDFEERDWLPHSGWPITRSDLNPFYERAQDLCQLGSTDFDDHEGWRRQANLQPIPLAGEDVVTRYFIFSQPTRFGEVYRSDIRQAQNVSTYLHSNVTEIMPDATASKVDRLDVATLAGNRFTIRPKLCVLATGGIENARMLLLSNSIQRAGLGNNHDLVGRYFMEHVHVPGQVAYIAIRDHKLIPDHYHAATQIGSVSMRAVLMLSDDFLRREKLMGTNMALYPMRAPLNDRQDGDDSPDALEPGVLQLLRSADIDDDDQESAAQSSQEMIFGISCATEQAPLPDSRVTLSHQRDALGLQRTSLSWQPSSIDHHHLSRNLAAVARAFGAWGKADVRILFSREGVWQEAETGWGCHHMGTTRMSVNPKHGVVDADCKVHGLANLYVAGSSVFTTGGAVNPTLTVVALALRLSDHLKSLTLNG